MAEISNWLIYLIRIRAKHPGDSAKISISSIYGLVGGRMALTASYTALTEILGGRELAKK